MDVIAQTGLRISDVLTLPADNIHLKMEIKERKTGKIRVVHITPRLRNQLIKYAYAHPSVDNALFDIAPSTFYRAIHAAATHFGYNHISAHSIRKMYAYEYCQRYGLRATQEELMHDNIYTTMGYVYSWKGAEENGKENDD